MAVVKVKHLSKTFGKAETLVNALKDINFTVNKNEYVVFMGPSGAGKSTLLNILAGLEESTRGSVVINGLDMTDLPDGAKSDLRREKIAIILQFFNLLQHLTVEENIELPLMLNNIPKKKRRTFIDHVLHLTGIAAKRDNFPGELSGGEQQRTAIARTLVMKPALLLADEPTGNLDSENGQKIIDLLHDLNKKEQLTVIQVTHDESMIRSGDRLIIIEDGLIESDNIIEEIQEK